MIAPEKFESVATMPQPDKRACFPAAVAFALRLHGENGRTPQQVDKVSGRKPNDYTRYLGIMKIDLWLLGKGYRVEKVHLLGSLPMDRFFVTGSELDYEDLVRRTRQYLSPAVMAKNYPKSDFERDRDFYRQNEPTFNRYLRSGRYKLTEAAISERDLETRLKGANAILGNQPGGGDSVHTVVLASLQRDKTYNVLQTGIFNPGKPSFDKSFNHTQGWVNLGFIAPKLVKAAGLIVIGK